MQDKENKKIGSWIPYEIKELFVKKEINYSEMLILSSIHGLSMEEPCYASNQYFSEFWGFGKKVISQTITNLKRKGYIEVKLFFKNTKEVEKRLITLTDKIKIEPQETQKEAQQEVAPTSEPSSLNADEEVTSENWMIGMELEEEPQQEPQQEPYKEELQEIYKPSPLNAEEIEEYINAFDDDVKPYAREYLQGKGKLFIPLLKSILKLPKDKQIERLRK